MNKKLKKSFYLKPTVEVAQDLLGKFLVHKYRNTIYQAMITETEAYVGFSDKACHAARGKTERNKVMFFSGGHAYIYLIYGMYYCLNVVTEKEKFPAAVLIRGLECDGLVAAKHSLDGPGKLCREFKITKENCNGLDLTGNVLWIEDRGIKPEFESLKRVGIDYAGESKNLLWRFRVKN